LAQGSGAEQDVQRRADEATARTLLEKSAAAGFPPAVEALALGNVCPRAKVSDNSEDVSTDLAEDGCGNSLLDLAARVAKRIEHLPDAEAENFLNELLGSLDEPMAPGDPGAEGLLEMLAGGDLDLDIEESMGTPAFEAWAAPCAAAA